MSLRVTARRATTPGSKPPEGRRDGVAPFISKGISREFKRHRPIVTLVLVVSIVARALLRQLAPSFQPRHLFSEGFVEKGGAEAHVLTARLLAEKRLACGAPLLFVKVDIDDVCGSLGHEEVWSSLSR